MKKTVLIVMLITILSKVLGFGREIVLSYFFGASSITDVYNISQTVPTTIFSFIGLALATSFIPIYSRVRAERSKEEASRFMSNLITVLLVLATVMVGLVLVFTEPVIRVFASGFTGETLSLAVAFTRISIFGIYFSVLIFIFNSFLQISNNFVIPAMLGLPLNFAAILSYVLAATFDVRILAYGILAGLILQVVFLLPSLMKLHFRYRLVFNLKDVYLREMLLLTIPVVIGVSVNQINVLVDKTLASAIAIGGISALNYAHIINGFVQGMFVEPVAVVMYPSISAMAAEDRMENLTETISQSLLSISLLIFPATVGSMVLAGPLVRLVFQRGAFDASAAAMTATALFYYSIGMTAYAYRDILSRTFYAMKDTKTPMVNAAVGMVINIVLNLILSRIMGLGGLALATSISAVATTAWLYLTLKKRLDYPILSGKSGSLLRIILASAIMGAAAFFTQRILEGRIPYAASVAAAIIVAIVLYGVTILFMRIEEVDTLKNIILRRIGKR